MTFFMVEPCTKTTMVYLTHILLFLSIFLLSGDLNACDDIYNSQLCSPQVGRAESALNLCLVHSVYGKPSETAANNKPPKRVSSKRAEIPTAKEKQNKTMIYTVSSRQIP